MTVIDTLANLAEPLGDDEIHVWQLAYDQVQGRDPLRAVLATYLDVAASEVRLIEAEHGRPLFADEHDQTLGFNWSHSGKHALVAIGRHIHPGIDLEQRRPKPRSLDLAQRFFHPDEARFLAELADSERDAAFLQLWTAKEAVLKSMGRGLAFGLHRLSIATADDQLALRHLEGDQADAWQLQRLSPGPTLIAALAWRGSPRRLRFGRLASTR